jgi:hypothetical protein
MFYAVFFFWGGGGCKKNLGVLPFNLLLQEKMEAKRHLQNKKEKPAKLVKPETANSAPVLKFASVRRR